MSVMSMLPQGEHAHLPKSKVSFGYAGDKMMGRKDVFLRSISRPTSDVDNSETVHLNYFKFGVCRVIMMNSFRVIDKRQTKISAWTWFLILSNHLGSQILHSPISQKC